MLLRRVAFPDFCEPCLPSPAAKPPAGAGWLHEIKHDGVLACRVGQLVSENSSVSGTLPMILQLSST
jgi:hypothetical protein